MATRDATFTVYTGAQRPGDARGAARRRRRPCAGTGCPPAADDGTAAGAWSIAASLDGDTVVAANGVLGLAYVLRGAAPPLPIALAGHADGPPRARGGVADDGVRADGRGPGAAVPDRGHVARLRRAAGLAGLLATRDGVLLLGGGATPLGVLAIAD